MNAWQLHQRIAAALERQRLASALFNEVISRFGGWR